MLQFSGCFGPTIRACDSTMPSRDTVFFVFSRPPRILSSRKTLCFRLQPECKLFTSSTLTLPGPTWSNLWPRRAQKGLLSLRLWQQRLQPMPQKQAWPSLLPSPKYVHCFLFTFFWWSGQQKLENWFHNHRPRNEAKTKTKKRDKGALINWQVRNVVQQTKKDAIMERMAINAPGVTQEDDAWISTYQKACTDVITDLTPEETKECENLAKEWNSTGPDATTKAMWVEVNMITFPANIWNV